ncbi:TetR/AcrR family transcriptional regulator [Streptomyces sp. NPDC050504]|uniref:TetR/AcrR family transcriptional regulator n=1 Tax=Streptomyces sp. NPDC050504 TaxID=3365618 RepID=UPI0037BB7931
MTAGTTEATGLRERKKQRTHNALLRAALHLFSTQGYERTTVDEIAEAVDVSQRTFFRYFASKEDVAFTVQRMVESHFVAAVRARPAAESPFEAMRGAVLGTWDGIGEAIEELVPVELHMRTYRTIESTPVLLAAHLRRTVEVEREIAEVIAEREGLDVEADPRPRVAVAMFSGVMRVTAQLWGRGADPGLDALRALTEAYLDRLTPDLLGDWRQPGGGPTP